MNSVVIPLAVKLWTLQHRELHTGESDQKLIVSWDRTPENWRDAYRWMASQWHKRIGPSFDSAPFWCWHSCNGKHFAPPTVGTAAMLMGDWNYYAQSTVLIELNAPDELCLLSSYSMWNDAVDDFLENKRNTIHDARFDMMFHEPLMKHPDDDIQAVIPYIMPDWIIDVRDLPKSDDHWEIAV